MRRPKKQTRRGWFPSFLFGGITDYLEDKDNREWAMQEIQKRSEMIPIAPKQQTIDADDALVFTRCIRQLLRTHEWTSTEVEHVFVALCHLGGDAARRKLVLLLIRYLMDTYPRRPCYILGCHFVLSNIDSDARAIALARRMDAFEFPTGEKIRSWLFRSPKHAKAVLLRPECQIEPLDLVRLVTWGNVRPGNPRDGCLEALALVALLGQQRTQDEHDDCTVLWEHLVDLWRFLSWWPRVVLIRNAPAVPRIWKLGWDEDCEILNFETASCILRHNKQTIVNNYWASQAVCWLRHRGENHKIATLPESLVIAATVQTGASMMPPGSKLRPLRGDSWMEPCAR